MHVIQDAIAACIGEDDAARLIACVSVPDVFPNATDTALTRDSIAAALCLLLLRNLLIEVPEAARYVEVRARRNQKITFDHGALRTVRADGMGALPCGELAITRILKPLGYGLAGLYPLPRLQMTGRAYAHADGPAYIPQFFVSEIHPEGFSPAVQAAARSVFADSRDPLDGDSQEKLAALARDGALPFSEAVTLLPVLTACFDRQHPPPKLDNYETLLSESAEFAWIATEGNRFNHATDRVSDLARIVAELRAEGFAMKDSIEVSAAGSVRQTAFKAARVARPFIDRNGQVVECIVPGSFFEFIARDDVQGALDLRFDSSNAQGIFKMTAAKPA